MSLTTVHSYIIIFLWTYLSHVSANLNDCGSNIIPQPSGLNLFYSEETDSLNRGPLYCQCFNGSLPNGDFAGTMLHVTITINAQRINLNANSDIVFAIGRDNKYFGGILRSDDDGVTLKNKKANLALTPKENESLINTNSLIQKILNTNGILPDRDPRRYLPKINSNSFKQFFERINDNGFGLFEVNNNGIDFEIEIFSDPIFNYTEVIYSKGGDSYSIIYEGSYNNNECLFVMLDNDISPLEQTIINNVTIIDNNIPLNPNDPCDDISQNVMFIIDESGSVGQSNYEKSVLFIRDIIKDIVPINSIISGVAFGTNIDIIYNFTDIQSPRISTVIPAFEDEANDFNGQVTNTAGALYEAINQFNTVINNGNDNILILLTDGQPFPSSNDPCNIIHQQIIIDLITLGVLPNNILIIGVGGFPNNALNCLTNNIVANIILIPDFLDSQFDNAIPIIEELLCPTNIVPAKQKLLRNKNKYKEINNNNNDNNNINDNDSNNGNKFITLNLKTIFGFEMGLVIGFIIIVTLLIFSIIIGIYNCRTKKGVTLKYESVSTDTVA